MVKIIRHYLCCVFLLLSFLCSAQGFGNWSVEAVGTKGFDKAPLFSSGVQLKYDALSGGDLRFGIGLGLRIAKPMISILLEGQQSSTVSSQFLAEGNKNYADQLGVYAPLFVSAAWFPGWVGTEVHPFIRLDAGYLFRMNRDERSRLRGFFLEPQAGVSFRNGLYASVGFWLQQVRYISRTRTFAPDAAISSEGSATNQSLTPSVSLHLGMRF